MERVRANEIAVESVFNITELNVINHLPVLCVCVSLDFNTIENDAVHLNCKRAGSVAHMRWYACEIWLVILCCWPPTVHVRYIRQYWA